jgi:hypothetical protein
VYWGLSLYVLPCFVHVYWVSILPLFLSLCMFYFSTTDSTSGEGTAYPSGAPAFTPGFSGVRIPRSLVFMQFFVDRCLSICSVSFVVLSVFLRFTNSDYPFWYLQPPLSYRRYLVYSLGFF